MIYNLQLAVIYGIIIIYTVTYITSVTGVPMYVGQTGRPFRI